MLLHSPSQRLHMDKQRLIRKLNSVGKEAFVSHYFLFKAYANNRISKDRAIEELIGEGRSNADGASIRLQNAKAIFNERGNCEALMMIHLSKRLTAEIIKMAKDIYKEECGSESSRA